MHQNCDPMMGRVNCADGLKTGHTAAAGYGLVGSAQRDGRRVILVVNGLGSERERQEEGVKLMEWAFRNFESKKIISKGEKIDEARVWLGETGYVPMVAEKEVFVVMPRAKRNELKLTVSYNAPLKAPLKAGESVGKLKIEVPGQRPVEVGLLAGADEGKKGLFGRAGDRLNYLLTGKF